MRLVGRWACPSALLAIAVLLTGCPKKNVTAEGEGGVDAGAADGAVGTNVDGGGGGDDVEPVYDTKGPPVEIAVKLCTGLHEMPEKKRAACCSTTPGIVMQPECVRNLSAALRANAIELTQADVDSCLAAFDKTLDGCDWVGPFPPGPPPACMTILKGKIGAGAKCRSTLECKDGMRCIGVGPTTAGKCSAAKNTGESCGHTTDTLATFVRQNDVDIHHPECKEKCFKHKCSPPIADGGECQSSVDCDKGLQCIPVPGTGGPGKGMPKKKCGPRANPKENEACPGGVCDGDLQCINNKCTARKPAGETCSADHECRGGCLKGDGGATGKCGMRCDLR
jgi:hypothetical protein